MPQLAFKRQEVARFVIPIYHIYRDILVEDLFALDAQLAGIGVDDGQAMALGKVRAQHRLFIRPFAYVFRFDEAEITTVASDGACMINQDLKEEIALIARQFNPQFRIVRAQRWHHVAHYQVLGYRRVVDATHSG